MRRLHQVSKRRENRIRIRMEQLESREMLDASGSLLASPNAHQVSLQELVNDINWSTSDVNSSFLNGGDQVVFTPTIVGGSASGAPADSPSNAIDSNVPAGGTFGGVAHIKILVPNFPKPITGTSPQQFDTGNPITAEFSCTGTVVAPTFVLTASHCFDAMDETNPVDGSNELNPGNGIFDPGTTAEVQLNNGDVAGNGTFSSVHSVSTITMHPSFEGFVSGVNDDVALLELSTPVPVGTPIYSITDTIISDLPSQRINMVGYGLTGSGDTGLILNPSDPDYRSPEVKRQRQNVADLFIRDDETTLWEVIPGVFVPIPEGPDEVFVFDFDGPSGSGFLGSGTLGNNVEGNIAPGDSGGPSFLMDDLGNLLLDSWGRPILGGINTFNGAFGFGQDPGQFVTSSAPAGGLSGGIMLGAYYDWINSIIGVDLDLSSTVTVEPGSGGNTKVTYVLDVTNNGPNDATGVTINQTQADLPPGATVSIDGLTSGIYFGGTWYLGPLATSDSSSLTLSIEFDPSLLNVGDPFNIGYSVDQVVEPDTDDSNDSVLDAVSLDVPLAASIGGTSWIVDDAPLNIGANGTLSWVNLDSFAITYAGPLAAAPPVQVYGPTDGVAPITATLASFDGITAEYTVPVLTEGYYKIVANGADIDFSVKPGDANGTKNVDILDFGALISKYNPGVFLGGAPMSEDFNGTGTVDVFDFGVFITTYLTDLSAYVPPTVPPPPPPAPAQLMASAAIIDAVWAEDIGADEDENEKAGRRRRGR